MVTSAHEGMHRIFQERPEILTPVFDLLGIELPQKSTVEAIVSDATENRPLARYVDTVLRVTPADGDAFLLAVESQEKRNPKKEVSWPYYVSYLQSKYDLPVLLLVVCRDRATAKWATGPFACEARGWTAQRTYPLVVGPDNVPMITDERTAAEKPAMAAFAALTHANNPRVEAILEALARGSKGLSLEDSDFIVQFLDAALGNSPAGDKWRNFMGFINYFPGRGTVMERAYLEGKEEGREEGMAEGAAKGVLRVLEVRGLTVSDDLRARITASTDLPLLARWLDLAGTVETVEELFETGTDGSPDAP
ncbi:hypothetical protein AB0D49_02730 [Streptomyces sp. NPDC048290]|uniref:hypothetical protein n=1 Tax=Streptomyces sp. NPDC048290 TaxID=3155811 RepID=UPI00341CE7D7